LEIGPFGLDELATVSKQLIREYAHINIWLFEGEMGAGKTTLIKQVCKQLGVLDTVTSPTYSIVNEYLTENGDTIYHFDFYRLKHDTEALDIGVDEYFNSDSMCLIEWSSKISDLLPTNTISIELGIVENDKRKIFITY